MSASDTYEKQADILEFWRAVEYFSPQRIPRVRADDPEPVFLVEESAPLPWQQNHQLHTRLLRSDRSGRTWRYEVFCGAFPLEEMRAVLEDQLGKDPESFDERRDGETCLFTFSVSSEGRPLFESFVLSSCAWAVGRTLSPGPSSRSWLQGFEETAERLAEDFASRLAPPWNDEEGNALRDKGIQVGRLLEYDEIRYETQQLARELGISKLIGEPQIRIRVWRVSTTNQYEIYEQSCLNSFFTADLGHVGKEVRRGNIGEGLNRFLSSQGELNTSQRIDIRQEVEELYRQIAPHHFPRGRWPSKVSHPLVFSQQLALNTMTKELMDSRGLFAVDGPPGTGKTTLLRDLIAAVVVERAVRLAQLSQPKDAFTGEKRWMSGEYTRVISLWREELQGFEMVVASNNNGAVENVTLEIPGAKSVDEDASRQGEVDYFKDFADRLLEEKKPAWALMAARLGNKRNRRSFLNRFWYPDSSAKAKGDVDEDNTPGAEIGFLNYLKELENEPELVSWTQAKRRFKRALTKERHLRKKREELHSQMTELPRKVEEVDTLTKRLAKLTRQEETSYRALEVARTTEADLKEQVERARARRLKHRQFRPGLQEVLFTLGKSFRTWKEKDKVLEGAVEDAERRLKKAVVERKGCEEALIACQQEQQEQKRQLNAQRRHLDKLQGNIERARSRYGEHVPDVATWGEDEETRERSSPWGDVAWNAARNDVFLEALRLHKAFIAASARRIRRNLQGAADILAGKVPREAPQQAVEAAWHSLFFVLPVVSTTFASFDRLFAHLGRESIGWLLIDEAGQAHPGSAAGALWRARRAVVVGDPMQLQPIVTIPFTVQQALRRHFGVAETWLPSRTSVQELADRTNHLGTYLERDDSKIWVGAPLRVHRRCDQPMFDISNKVAYDELMVYATPSREPCDLHKSAWLNVRSSKARGHWIPAEGRLTERVVRKLLKAKASASKEEMAARDIFLISPFRAVAQHLRSITWRHNQDLWAGTIHTVQGKEAKVVILVLGGDPSKPGAKAWASEHPNLINVAVSRACRRLYVIGDREAWKKYRYFSILANLLPKHDYPASLLK